MQEIDEDGSGEVEFEEFLTWWGSKDRTGEQVQRPSVTVKNRTQILIIHLFYLFSTPPHWGDNRILPYVTGRAGAPHVVLAGGWATVGR